MRRCFAIVSVAAIFVACGGAAPLEQRREIDAGVDGDAGPDGRNTGTDGGPGDAGPAGPGNGTDGGPGDAGPDAGPPPVHEKFFALRPSPIARENQRTGASGWQCRQYNAALGAYTDRVSYLPGDEVSVRAAFATQATTATWQLWRMGYYGGALGRLMSAGGPVTVVAKPPNTVDPATGAVSAPWPVAFTFRIPQSAVTGIYLLKLVTAQGDTLTPFVVRETTPMAPILYSVSTNTYQAYNAWGGTSLYANSIGWKPPGATSAPWHAFAVSFDRPYETGQGTGDFLAKDRDFVTFAEGQGYDIAYVTDTDLDADPSLASYRRMLVIQGHSEYWTAGMRDTADAAIAAGTNAAFFAANDAYWQVRFADPARRLLIGYKEFCQRDPMLASESSRATCLWRDPLVGRAENALIGEMFGDWIWAAAPMRVDDPSSWIWSGTGVATGTVIAGVYQNESDLRFDNGVEPAGINSVATGFVQSYFGAFNRAETTLYTDPGGARVFAAGSIGFSRMLAGEGRWDPIIQQLVANVFAAFTDSEPLPAKVTPLCMSPPASHTYRAGVRVSTVTNALTQPAAVAVAPDGTVVVADGNRIVRVDANGVVTTVAGSDRPGNVDGPALQARFNSPRGVAVASSGAIYVSDTANNRIRVIQNGTVSPLAGAGVDGFADGQGVAARFAQPMGIAMEANGNLLVADSVNSRLREVTPQGVVTTWAGTGVAGVERGGPGASAPLHRPMAVAVDAGGAALIVEPDTGLIRSVDATTAHVVSSYAGQLFVEGWQDGPTTTASVYHTVAIAVRTSDGQVVLVDGASARIRAIRNGTVDTLAGGHQGGTVDGAGSEAGFASPRGVAIAPDGSAYVVDAQEHTLRRVTGF